MLREIARRAIRPQSDATFSPRRDFTVIDCYSEVEFRWHIDWLDRERLVYKIQDTPEIAKLSKNHIDWETPDELRDRLYKRIRATILEQA